MNRLDRIVQWMKGRAGQDGTIGCIDHPQLMVGFTMALLWQGIVWYCMVWYGMVWYGIVWYGMVWYGMAWYGVVWLGGYDYASVG